MRKMDAVTAGIRIVKGRTQGWDQIPAPKRMNMRRKKPIKALSLALILVLAASALGGCGKKEDAGSSSASSGGETNEYLSYGYSDGLTDEGFWKDIRALDYVTLPSYKGMEIPADVQEVSDEDLQEQIDALLDEYTETVKVTDREVKDEDTVNIDYVGSVDGVEFEGGSTGGKGTTVTIGVTQYIDDFLEQLIGHKPGDTFNVEVTFPEDYGQEHLNGKDAVFVTTINYISEEVPPELTDAFVEEKLKNQNGWSTVEEMKNGLRDGLRESAENTYLWDTIMEQAEVREIPEVILDAQEKLMLKYYAVSADQLGMGLSEFLSYYTDVDSVEELLEKYKDDVEDVSKAALVRQALFEDMGLSASDEDVSAYFKDTMGVDDYTEYSGYYGMPYVRMMVMAEMMTDQLREQAVRL